MSFDTNGKIALITGGASGIGFHCAKDLLNNGLKAVTLVDINDELGSQALAEINQAFGPNRAIFVKADVSDKAQLENAFQKTTETFKHIDIVLNCAGILNDTIWEKEIAINVNGTVHGILLALEFIPKHRTASEGVIVNFSSIAGVMLFPNHPVYMATKHAVVAMTRGFGYDAHYQDTKVKVVALCPGPTNTALLKNMPGTTLGPRYDKLAEERLAEANIVQEPEYVAKAVRKIIEEAKSGSIWVCENYEEIYEVQIPTRFEMRK